MKTFRHISLMILITWFFTEVGATRAEEDHRVFMSADGRRIVGRLMGFNPDEQTATVARQDGKEYQVLLELFSEIDQQYIREQSAMRDFMHSLKILPRLRKFDATGKYNPACYKAEYVQSLGYVISLKNLSPTLFEEVEIEYCLFYRQGERHETGMKFMHGVQCGRWKPGSVMPGSAHVLETDHVLIYDTGSTITFFGNDGCAQGGIDGIWLRIAATLPTGDRVLREFRSSTLNDKYHPWVTSGIAVGLNHP